jgi:hypothetical protein
MRPVVSITRIQPAVSRLTINQPTKLRAAISHRIATLRNSSKIHALHYDAFA